MKLLSIIIQFVVACSVYADEFGANKIVGTWGDGANGYNKYSEDGTILSWGEIPNANIKYEILSTYELEQRDGDTYSCITVTGSSHPEIMSVGESWCDKIIKVTDTEFTYITSEGNEYTMHRQ